ncbi:hypothetical protein EGT74_13115 [Chitinophaga lutea]|uniref:Terpene synthase n=1 Tax=Chitinophaga lutea TaxID=2488634 RepID=A0A3N4PKF4_9BACT|nr:terpene synthase family protein [Chitinophaga lutea]RPE08008.1 hypothetical protein EGT74_13115 [Chitinophaga lutea]
MHVATADQHTADWLMRFGLVRSEEHLNHYRRQGFAWMVARMFPNAGLEELCAFTDLNTLLFLLDDYLDHQESSASPENRDKKVKAMIDGFIRVLRQPKYGEQSGNPVFVALAELWQRMKKMSSRSWQRDFIQSIVAIFTAAIWQHENVKAGKWPLLADYMEQRQYLGAANIATDTIAVVDKIRLPRKMYEHPLLQELTALCRNTVCWANDLFSLSKEIAHGDYHNLVVLLSHEENISMEEAIVRACEIHDDQVKQFMRLCRYLPNEGPVMKMELHRYVEGLKNIMRANIDWSDYETSRYQYEYEEHVRTHKVREHYLMEAAV